MIILTCYKISGSLTDFLYLFTKYILFNSYKLTLFESIKASFSWGEIFSKLRVSIIRHGIL